MEGYKHFSHPHTLTFLQSLEDAQHTCTGCNLPCTDTPVYTCRECNFFLHNQCFDATRSLIHPSHPDHPLSLFSSPTYPSGFFICKSCNKTGSGFSFGCSTCDFDLHIHCAYKTLNPKPSLNPPPNQITSSRKIVHVNPNPNPNPNRPPSQITLKSHPRHPLKHIRKLPYTSGLGICNVCGTNLNPNHDLYHCDICGYDAHVACTKLPETVRREDHKNVLLLRYVNPYPEFECDVCGHAIQQNHCMYACESCGDYGTHVKCVSRMVSKKPRDDFELKTLYWIIAVAIVLFAIAVFRKNGHFSNASYHHDYGYRNYPY